MVCSRGGKSSTRRVPARFGSSLHSSSCWTRFLRARDGVPDALLRLGGRAVSARGGRPAGGGALGSARWGACAIHVCRFPAAAAVRLWALGSSPRRVGVDNCKPPCGATCALPNYLRSDYLYVRTPRNPPVYAGPGDRNPPVYAGCPGVWNLPVYAGKPRVFHSYPVDDLRGIRWVLGASVRRPYLAP